MGSNLGTPIYIRASMRSKGRSVIIMEARSKNVAIIGAGICGVSTAICLQEADPSLQLTIVAEKFSPDLTSDGAAGLWSVVPGHWMKDTARAKRR